MNALESHPEMNALLKRHFGFDEFRAGQPAIIERLAAGRSALAVFPTGGGKSLCYQLPALTFDGVTLVVSPLIALMKDQVDQLARRGIAAVRLDSTLSLDEYRRAMQSVRSGETKLLYVAPERFFNERFRAALQGLKISLFAIDEAHCISQWGHHFRPDYLKLASLARQLRVERVLALTATATPPVVQDICAAFDIASEDAICTPFFRPNLYLRSHILTADQQLDQLRHKLQHYPAGPTIVYVSLQKTAEQIAEQCVAAGLPAKPYHAGLPAERRAEIQDWFMADSRAIVVATIAFGMGIDKADIRYVYHYQPPKSLENYAQEIGRAGRDGKVSHCELLLVPEDRVTLENFVYGDTPTAAAVASFVNEMKQQPPEFYVSHIKLSHRCDIKILVVRTLLTYLELDGYLESLAPRYDEYSFKPLVTSLEILEGLQGEQQSFAKRLLACAKKRATWFGIDLPATMEKLKCDRQRIIKALESFSEQGWIELKVTGLVHGYRKLRSWEESDDLIVKFVKQIEDRESLEISRIDQVFALASTSYCQAATLSEHFGQTLEKPCGNCTACLEEGPREILALEGFSLESLDVFPVLRELAGEYPELFASSRVVARFLCGLTSPALTKNKLSRHAQFGICRHIPFGEVMRQVESAVLTGES